MRSLRNKDMKNNPLLQKALKKERSPNEMHELTDDIVDLALERLMGNITSKQYSYALDMSETSARFLMNRALVHAYKQGLITVNKKV
jgi:hypothetical protein